MARMKVRGPILDHDRLLRLASETQRLTTQNDRSRSLLNKVTNVTARLKRETDVSAGRWPSQSVITLGMAAAMGDLRDLEHEINVFLWNSAEPIRRKKEGKE